MVNRTTVLGAADPLYLAGAVLPGVRRVAAGMHRLTRTIAPAIWQGQGYSQTGGPEHASGRALDLIVPAAVGQATTATERAQGDRLAAWLIAHADDIGLQWVIWRQRIYNTARPGWRVMEDRGGITNNHHDHLHIMLTATADWPAHLDTDQKETPMEDAQFKKLVKEAINEWFGDPTAYPLQPSERGRSVRGSSLRNVLIHLSDWTERMAKQTGVAK